MTLLTLTAATPIAWTQIGPLATSEHWTVREGVILLTTETVLSDQQGEFFGIGSRVIQFWLTGISCCLCICDCCKSYK